MADDAKRRRLDSGSKAVDRFSNLPGNLKGLILERLPLYDAARTAVLSKIWGNIWTMLPWLVFDHVFFLRMVSGKDEQAQVSNVSRTISNILLLHNGPVSKFHLYVPRSFPLQKCLDADLWIKRISNSGIKILELINRTPYPYPMPSYMFSCLELTHLTLDNCILNPPRRFGGFSNLIEVTLSRVKITADVLFGTRLERMRLDCCTGIKHLGCQFNSQYNLIRKLHISTSEEIDWQWFKNTEKLHYLGLVLAGSSNSRKNINDLDNLLGNMPDIYGLYLDNFFLTFLEPDAPLSNRLTTTLVNLKTLQLSCAGGCNWVFIQRVFCLIRSSPKLKNLHIWPEFGVGRVHGTDSMAASRVEQNLLSPDFVNMILDQLETVHLQVVIGSRCELHFIKLLLASSPSLRWIKISKSFPIHDLKDEFEILRKVARFPRASATAELIWP
ncbi:F-box/FBD/LRR-repeat protein At1g13570-like isoform X2 [Daucus carota subsp. sativus]|nr:PREDICTED: F-box/FBD/LRR-repeat protein At1g13570-like isoform X2 [Daucus carota subsp. sativus]